jgi:hypothetical protein
MYSLSPSPPESVPHSCLHCIAFFCCVTGTSITSSHPGTPARQFYTVGPSVHPGRTDTSVTVRYDEPPRQRAYACKPHEHCFGEYSCHVGSQMQKNSLARTHARTHTLTFAQLFKRMLDQFDRLKKRNAFLEQYKKERMFENGLEEFDDARYGSDRALHFDHRL